MIAYETIEELLADAGSQFVSVNFTKADGSERQLTFNPRDFADIKGTGKPASDPNIFRVRDIKLGQWRSFDARRVHSIRVGGRVVKEAQ
jgi:hypothetical protein